MPTNSSGETIEKKKNIFNGKRLGFGQLDD